MDDLNMILTNPLSEPDPVLKSQLSSDAIPRGLPDSGAGLSKRPDRGKPPRTSEVFQRFGPQTAEAARGAVAEQEATCVPGNQVFEGDENAFEKCATPAIIATPRDQMGAGLGSDDDQLAESRTPWALLLIMSYASAVTLALTWVLLTGRTFRFAENPTAGASAAESESALKSGRSALDAPLPPLPPENVTTLGHPVRLGDLEVTPLELASSPLELVRSIEPAKSKREASPSLLLRLKLRNVSASQDFSPVERRFVREQGAAVDRSLIVTNSGKPIYMYPLAIDSEWSIVGEEFRSLKPGESMETVIASEPGGDSRLVDDAIWRVRVRVGLYRTDVLGVRFEKGDVSR
jgi:hypothetical protein